MTKLAKKFRQGVRQSDPLSLILFNIVVDMLAIIINRAKSEGQITKVVPNLTDDGLSILQYADDIILFMDHKIDQARNMKLLLSAFEKLFSLKINFHKNEIFCFGQAKIMNWNMNNYLVVKEVHNPSDI
jgi:hypothetical protein